MHNGICLVNLQHPEDKTNTLEEGDPITVADRTQFEWLISVGSIREADAPAPTPEKATKKATRSD
jgi:hypothetical protein